MFGRRFWGGRYFGARYWGEGEDPGVTEVAPFTLQIQGWNLLVEDGGLT